MRAVIDTNVLLVANEQHADVSPDCVAACVRRLVEMQAHGGCEQLFRPLCAHGSQAVSPTRSRRRLPQE